MKIDSMRHTRRHGVRTAILAGGLLLAGGLTGRSAFAQTTLPVQKPFTIKLGAYFPTDSAMKDATGNAHFMLGATYELGKTRSIAPFRYGIYADGIFHSSKSYHYFDFVPTENDDESRQEGDYVERSGSLGSSGWALGVFGRYFLSAPMVPVRPYAGLGVGFYSERIDGSFGSPDGSFGGSTTKNGIGGKAIIGIESKMGLTGEVSYNLFPDEDGVNLSGFGVAVGYRF